MSPRPGGRKDGPRTLRGGVGAWAEEGRVSPVARVRRIGPGCGSPAPRKIPPAGGTEHPTSARAPPPAPRPRALRRLYKGASVAAGDTRVQRPEVPALRSSPPGCPRLRLSRPALAMRCAPTAGAALVLCAATAGLLSAQARPAPSEPPRPASWDEVNVLAHGLLQLGRGLREHVESTRAQLGALRRRLDECGPACRGPGAPPAPSRAPHSAVAGGEEAPETLRGLQVRAPRAGCAHGKGARASGGTLAVAPEDAHWEGWASGRSQVQSRPSPPSSPSPDAAPSSGQQDRAAAPEGGPAAATPGEAALENPESAEPGILAWPGREGGHRGPEGRTRSWAG